MVDGRSGKPTSRRVPCGRVSPRAPGVGTRPTFTDADRERRARDGIAHISKQFVRYGVTGVHHQGGNLVAIQDVRARGELLHRVSYEVRGSVLDSMIGIYTGFGDKGINLGATAEHGVDGSFSERIIALSQPYPGITPEHTGTVTETQDELNDWVERVDRAGIQVNCHANGDVAIDMFLTAVERAQKLFPREDARPKITHCTLINDGLIRRMAALENGGRRQDGTRSLKGLSSRPEDDGFEDGSSPHGDGRRKHIPKHVIAPSRRDHARSAAS